MLKLLFLELTDEPAASKYLEQLFRDEIVPHKRIFRLSSSTIKKFTKIRHKMFKYVISMTFKLKLNNTTLQLSVVYMDALFDKLLRSHNSKILNEVDAESDIYSITLLMIAAKFNERNEYLPFISDFGYYDRNLKGK